MMPSFLISRLTATASSFTHLKSTQIQLGSLLLHKYHNAFFFFFNSFASDGNNHKGDTFTMSFLINSCGLSPELSMKLSNRVSLKNPEGPNAVLDLLKNYGFSKTQVAQLVVKYPLVLVANAENTLSPKLKFFRSIGVSNTDMRKILSSSHDTLRRSLVKCLIPRYEILRNVVRDDQEAVRVLKNFPFYFSYGVIINDFVPNIEVLRQRGVPQASISLLMINFAGAAHMKHPKFVEAVKRVEEIGFNPLKTNFVMALQVFLTMNKAGWESRLVAYERWGWSHETALRAFKKFPNFVKLSVEVITKKMSFLVNEMGLPSQDIAEYPPVLAYSLEKRMIPRFSVIKILKSKGLLDNKMQFGHFMGLTEEKFLKRFVINFQEDVPLLLDVYKSLINHRNII